jgi:class 3 adenylate cyclase
LVVAALQKILIRRGLLFQSSVEEAAYQQFRLSRTYRWIPIAIGAALVAWLAFSVFDSTAVAAGPFPTRFRALGGLVLLALLGASFLDSARRNWRVMASTFYAVGTLLTLRISYLMEDTTPFGLSSGVGPMNMVIVLCIGLGVCPLSIGLGGTLGILTILLYVGSVLRFTDLIGPVLVAHVFNLIVVFLTLMAMGVWRERSLRQEFGERRRLLRERNILDKLVADVLPRELIARIDAGERIAEAFGEVTVLFADLVGFTRLTSRLAPRHLVEILDQMFSAFDEAVERERLDKVKTIGDAYMVIGGTREDGTDSVAAATRLAFEMLEQSRALANRLGHHLDLRIGIHTGSVIGGVIGRSKKVYDYWGETVNVASRLESTGEAGRVRVSEAVYWRLNAEFEFETARPLEQADGSRMPTYFVLAPESANAQTGSRDGNPGAEEPEA